MDIRNLFFKSRSYTPIPILLMMLYFARPNSPYFLLGIVLIVIGEIIRLRSVSFAGGETRTMNEKTELIGILGLGFLGKELAALTSWEEGSWGSWHSSPISSCPLEQFHFDWEGVSSWSGIPVPIEWAFISI